ncbi:MAG TPA: glycosyltransferase family 2 protein [Fulvivirga sp.]|nr:glycosyltransferase family 2 protein [Fulvivirga sp.]
MSKVTLSIIIPVYNVEKYILQCIESIYQSTNTVYLQDFEVIVVDDCSPDSSILVIEECLNKYENIKLFTHEVNKGLGGARNTGIKNSKGKFVTFLDSDDFYFPHAIEKLIVCLKNTNKDSVLIFGFKSVQDKIIKWQYIPNNINQITAKEALLQLSQDKITPAAWNKVYPKNIVDKIHFEPHIYYEDLEFTPRAINKCTSVKFLPEALINYRLEGNSITRQTIGLKHIDDFLTVLYHLNKNLLDERIFSNFFFNRWKHLLNIWQLDEELLKYTLSKLLEISTQIELTRPSKEYHSFMDVLMSQYYRYSTNPEINEIYAKILSNLEVSYPYFSIIIPVFNAEPFIEKAIRNFTNQKFGNFELVLVDDCSTDNSVSKIKSLQSELDFINLIELKSNSGAGAARNIGLEGCKGKYVIFNDADDWFDQNGLEIIYNHLVKNQFPELVVHSFSVYNEHNKFIWANEKIESLPDKAYTGIEIFKKMSSSEINPSPWNKVFLKDLWIKNNIRFPEDIHHQDLAAIPFAAYKAKTASVLRKRLYNYVKNTSGVTQTVSDKHVVSPFKAIEVLFNFFKQDNTFELWQEELIQLAFETFDYNLGLRANKFNDEQLLSYLDFFNSFCLSYHIEPHYLFNSLSATSCMKKLNDEVLKRGLNGHLLPFQKEGTFEKLLAHYIYITEQHKMILKYANKPVKTTPKLVKSDNNDLLVKQNAWYSRTYDHLPKWYLKIGSIFRRI